MIIIRRSMLWNQQRGNVDSARYGIKSENMMRINEDIINEKIKSNYN